MALLSIVAMAVIIPVTRGKRGDTSGTVNGCSPTDPQAGCQGVVGALPATSSQATASGTGDFSDLKVTVNQTTNLINQAVSVTWKAVLRPTSDQRPDSFNAAFNGDYLQIFECWSRIGATPNPSQCEFGGEAVHDQFLSDRQHIQASSTPAS